MVRSIAFVSPAKRTFDVEGMTFGGVLGCKVHHVFNGD